MTIEERFDRLTTVRSAHADRIEGPIRAAESHREQISALIRATDGHPNQIDALARIAESRQDQIDAHDAQIGALIATFQQQAAEDAEFDRPWESTRILVVENARATANLERQWQAYINTLPRQ
jgi:hypothetical protein